MAYHLSLPITKNIIKMPTTIRDAFDRSIELVAII